ncbi:phage tail tube protein [Kitasatospora sp. NPDC001664]
MAGDDKLTPAKSAELVPGTGFIFAAPVAEASKTFPELHKLTDAAKIVAEIEAMTGGWKSIGNTSLENGIEMASEGDEPEVLGSWQAPSLRTTNPKKVYSLTMALHDFTAETFKLYYGSSKGAEADGTFAIPVNPEAQDRALLIVGVDGTKAVAWHYAQTKILGSDAVSIDPAAMSEMPVKATVVAPATADRVGTVTPVFQIGAAPTEAGQ